MRFEYSTAAKVAETVSLLFQLPRDFMDDSRIIHSHEVKIFRSEIVAYGSERRVAGLKIVVEAVS